MSDLKSLQRLLVVQAIYEISINKERIKEETQEILRDIVHNLDLGKKLEMRKFCRVSIDIENNTDSEWQLDVKKSRANPPPHIRNRLRNLIDSFSRPSVLKQLPGRNKKLATREKKPVWERVATNKDKEIIYKISKENPSISSLFDSLDDNLSLKLENIFSLIEKCVPYPEIAHDFTEKPKSLKKEEFSIKELRELAISTKDSFIKKGISLFCSSVLTNSMVAVTTSE